MSGEFLAITHFYPEDGAANAAAISDLRLAPFVLRDSAFDPLALAGFEAELKNVRRGSATPTPVTLLLEGAEIDAPPIAGTELERAVLVGL